MSFNRFPKKIVHEVGPKGEMTKEELSRFDSLKLEYVEIEKTSWKRKAEILAEMKENRLYRETHATFEKFVKDVFDIAGRTAYQLIASLRSETIISAEIEQSVHPGAQTRPKLTLHEKHIRELQKLPSGQMRKAAAKLKGKDKITQKDVEQAVKETKKDAAIQKQASIAGHVVTAMATAEEINKQCRAIKTACNALQAIMEGPFAVHMPTGQPLDQIKRHISLIAAGAPYADCVYCGSKGGNCKGCSGHGWVTKLQFNAIPYELKAKSKVHAEDDAA